MFVMADDEGPRIINYYETKLEGCFKRNRGVKTNSFRGYLAWCSWSYTVAPDSCSYFSCN